VLLVAFRVGAAPSPPATFIATGTACATSIAGHRSIEITERYIDGDTFAQRRLVGYV
jgi:hypothetical protein